MTTDEVIDDLLKVSNKLASQHGLIGSYSLPAQCHLLEASNHLVRAMECLMDEQKKELRLQMLDPIGGGV